MRSSDLEKKFDGRRDIYPSIQKSVTHTVSSAGWRGFVLQRKLHWNSLHQLLMWYETQDMNLQGVFIATQLN